MRGVRLLCSAAVLAAAAPGAATNMPPSDPASVLSPAAISLLQRGLHDLHDLSLREADESFAAVIATASNHPAGYVCRAITTWCFNMADGPSDARRRSMAALAAEAVGRGTRNAGRSDAWNDLFLGAAMILRAASAADNQDSLDAMGWFKRGFGRLILATRNAESGPDARILVGACQYFSDGLPWFVRQFSALFITPPDRAQGIEQLSANIQDATFFGPDAKFLLATAYAWDDDEDRALELLDELDRLFPRNHQLAALRQCVLLRAGSIAEAYLCASNCLARIEHDSRLYLRGFMPDQQYALGVIASAAARHQDALNHFATAFTLADRKPRLRAWAILRQGTTHDLLGQREDALRCYRAACILQTDTQLVKSYAELFLDQPYQGETLE